MPEILRIMLSEKKTKKESVPVKYEGLGGRGFTSTVIGTEVDPLCHPLSPENKLVVAPGIMGGTNCPCSGRASFGGKSPLTGGIKESNVGGELGTKLGKLGLAGIIFEGQCEELIVLFIDRNGVRLDSGRELTGALTYESAVKLKAKYGSKVAIAVIGPAGEARMKTACISVTDLDGLPTRQAGRGGLGALMGSKNVKAIVVDDTGLSQVRGVEPDGLKEASTLFSRMIKAHPVSGDALARYGTTCVLSLINEAGAFPTRNFSVGQFEKASEISGEKLNEVIGTRGGRNKHRCMASCIVNCSNTYLDENGAEITGGFEYESIWALGANCGIGNLDDLAVLNRLCDDIGVDTIETGVAIGVAMSAQVLSFGDSTGVINLLDEVRRSTPLGRIIGNGARVVGEAFGIDRVPVVKGQALSAYDPRAIKGMGVTYALSTMGADHTDAYMVGPEVLGQQLDPLSPEGKVQVAAHLFTMNALLDSAGLCVMSTLPLLEGPEGMNVLGKLIGHKIGQQITVDDLISFGDKIVKTERDFNKRAGFSVQHNRLPRFFRTEMLPPLNVVNDIDEKEMDDAYFVGTFQAS